MELSDFQAEAKRLSNFAHLATVGGDGTPHVAPIWPAWHDGKLWVSTHITSVKARNARTHPKVALHWQVDESGDGAMLWGDATVHDDEETRRRMWTGVFDYNLDDFTGGVDDPGTCFIAVDPQRAVALKAYGQGGRDVWTR
jgi:PPOX class probable F420-dependent enzyme